MNTYTFYITNYGCIDKYIHKLYIYIYIYIIIYNT